jgi:chromosome segregation ATPase
VKSTASSLKQYSVLKLSEQNKRNLEQEISGYKEEAQKMRKLIYSLEKDRDNRLNEINVIGQQLIEKNTEIKIKENDIFDAKKKIIDFEKKSKEQQALYENVRADRNVYSKNLLEAQDEIMELKRKLKIMNHQVDQLKEEISSRETSNLTYFI